MIQLNYTKELLKRFQNPKFVKDVKNPDAVGEVGNVACGDVMHLEFKLDKKTKVIKDIGFKTFGCGAAIAASDVVCELAKGKTLEQAKKIKKEDIVKALGGMPRIKVHCSILGIEALGKAIKNYEGKINGK
ncbi:iron-sulfur cluster assembly scaffold protein [archaeon]|jgi:NifU-like protein involved in Fe-S cluster formation|nr:iron-sulfur cluster assembly scaffold protein [archaeon]MBT4373437.1 iron-sulfur cluster assembly scaffold protein [archaeon]MBT4531885.1 iron-sulfur cluster assembly scaffold protein [archaeon]MBT7001552.1 iron-sulfur cluster assembly scaffold protein [archaeon]MBT7282556.1 iron-sulfur cluster assembly scaffold protein [archaeon]